MLTVLILIIDFFKLCLTIRARTSATLSLCAHYIIINAQYAARCIVLQFNFITPLSVKWMRPLSAPTSLHNGGWIRNYIIIYTNIYTKLYYIFPPTAYDLSHENRYCACLVLDARGNMIMHYEYDSHTAFEFIILLEYCLQICK